MSKSTRGAVAAAVVGLTLTTGAACTVEPSPDTVINVTQPSSGAFTMSQTTHRPGHVRFHFTSHQPVDSDGNGGMDVVLVKPMNNKTIADVERHIGDQQGPNGAASTRWLTANAQIFGGTGIEGKGTTDTDVELPAGRVYAVDTNAIFAAAAAKKDPTSAPKRLLTIAGLPYQSQLPRISSTISTTSSDTFQVTSTHLGSGQYLIRNISDTLHFVVFQPVKPGTTDADMTRAANQEQSGGMPTPDPTLHSKTGVNSDVLSPGRNEIFDSALLTPGTYDLECFIADDHTGMPHFFMGMHKIVVIP
jgi:hypothetical protein